MRRIGTEESATRALLLDATEQLMLDEGYAAVSTRRVAKQIGLTPALVHYYFPATDDLLVAVYRRAVDKTVERLRTAISSEEPLHALWRFSTDADCTALAMEFMAMANHRKAIRAEIASSAERVRTMQAAALSKLAFDKDPNGCDPLGVAALVVGIGRLLVMEGALGIALGHDRVRDIAEHWLDSLEPRQETTGDARADAPAYGRPQRAGRRGN